MDIEYYKNLIEYFLHETVNINDSIKTHTEIVSKGVNDKQGVPYHIDVIHENSSLLAILTTVVKYSLNKSFKVEGEKDLRNLHGKFKKAGISLKLRLKNKNIKLNLKSERFPLINLYPIIDTLPYILIDNAIKYSHKDSEINIEMIDLGREITISIENFGPEIFEDEKEKLVERGYRGSHADSSNIPGNGLGLSIAKDICESHNGSLEIKYGNDEYNFNGRTYKKFIVSIILPK
tara:strand:+ start:856 stop:1557 length:702 start_codon:yes stop_codon:yes gene_type:complete